MAAGPPRRRGGCTTALMLVGAVLVAGFVLGFVAHLLVALAAVVVGIVIVLAVWSFVRRWFA